MESILYTPSITITGSTTDASNNGGGFVDVHVEYITYEMNGLADAQSRFEYKRFNKMIKDWELTLDERHTNLTYYAELNLLKNTSVTKTQMTDTMERLFKIV